MIIRFAKKEDIDVLEGLYEFIQSLEIDLIKKIGRERFFEILEKCYKSEEDRYSYRNCRLIEIEGEIKGFYFSYEYDFLIKSREYWNKSIVSKYNLSENDVIFDYNEAFEGEYYLDILYVLENVRSQGIGKKLLEDFFKKDHELKSLNVAKSNTRAKKLYETFDMKVDCEIVIANHAYEHMILKR